jgi:amidohydrolase
MLEKGAMDDVDAFLMIHPDGCNRIAWGHNGRIAMDIEFHGTAAHAAAAPEKGINALDALILTYNGINALRQHVKDGARIHGIIAHGGNSPNIIPHFTKGSFYIRSNDTDYLFKLKKRVEEIARGAAAMTGAKVHCSEPSPMYLPSKMNRAMMEAFIKNYEILGMAVDRYEDYSTGSSDFGNVSQKIPSIHPYLKIHDGNFPLHTADMAEATLQPMSLEAALKGAKALAMTAVDLMCDPEFMRSVG